MSRHKLMDREKRRFIARELAHGIKGTGKALVFEDWVDEISVTLTKAEQAYYGRAKNKPMLPLAPDLNTLDSTELPGLESRLGDSK